MTIVKICPIQCKSNTGLESADLSWISVLLLILTIVFEKPHKLSKPGFFPSVKKIQLLIHFSHNYIMNKLSMLSLLKEERERERDLE